MPIALISKSMQISGADIRYMDKISSAISAEQAYMMNLMGSQAAGYGFFRIE